MIVSAIPPPDFFGRGSELTQLRVTTLFLSITIQMAVMAQCGKNRIKPYNQPGHGDEVYAVDWSPDGQRVASGGKDALLRMWRR